MMEETKKYDFYLAHPFNSRKEIREWELAFERRTGIELLNPFYDAEGRTDVELVDVGRTTRYEKLDHTELVKRDLLNIAICKKGIIAIIDKSAFICGTLMEIVYSHAVFGKRVYSIIINDHHEHPWLKYHSDEIFTSFGGLERFLSNGNRK